MGRHLSEQNRHLNNKKEQAVRTGKETSSAGLSYMERRMAGRTGREAAVAAIVPAMIAAVLLAAFMFVPLDGWMRCVAFLIPFVIAGFDVFMESVERIAARNYFDKAPVTLIAAIAAFSVGYYPEADLLLILFGVNRLVEGIVSNLCGRDVSELPSIKPETANVETAEGVLNVTPDCVNVGDIVVVPAGERIPLDGIIVEGMTTVDTASISGQSRPWAVTEGYRVYSGCRNLTSQIRVKVTKGFEQSTASRIVRLSHKAPDYKSNQEERTERFVSVYTPVMLAAAFLLAVIVPLFNGGWTEYIRRSAVLLIMACPAYASLAVSLAYIKAIGAAAGCGMFVKGSDCIESMAQSETVIFDKTGTITEGRYIVTDVFPVNMTDHELLTAAASAEMFSRHPIARALRDSAGAIDTQNIRISQAEELPGRGVSALVGDARVYVGNTALLEEHGITCEIPSRSGAAIHVAVDGRYCGHILVSDRVRSGAFDALESMRVQGVKKMVLLTGDVLSVARPLASKLNFDMLRAEQKPEDKLSAVTYLMSNKGIRSTVAFVGDGNTDGALMKRVDVGIAIGALGSDAAFISADVLMMDRDIKKLPRLFGLSRMTYRIALENMAVGICVSVGISVLGAVGIMPVLGAVICGFTLNTAVLLNAIRIK